MRSTLILFAVLTFTPTLAHGQSACAQLGVDCSHPNIDQRPQTPTCGPDCRREEQKRNDEYWERREAYDRERAAEKQRERERKAQVKAIKDENKRIDEANKLAAQAWVFMQKEDCSKAVDLYDKALSLTSFLQWSKNRTICLTNLHRFDAAYAQWETLINDRETPDADIKGMRAKEWNIMYDKGYVCPAPPRFNGIEGCYRRPDHKMLDTTYVPLPYIDGKTWTAKDVTSSGKFTVTTRDGHEWHNGEINMTTLNLLDARIKTGKGTVVRFLLPDDTTFVLGPNSDITINNFVYNPNESYSEMAISIATGLFRFVTGRFSHRDPTVKKVNLAVGNLGIRGCDVEIEHDPNGAGTPMSEGKDRWWVSNYDGDVNFVEGDSHRNFAIPVGQILLKVTHAEGYRVTYSNNYSLTGLTLNFDDSPGAAPAAIRQKAQLSVTDFWDSVIGSHVTGRQ
jgi:hypothetical protein